MDLTNDMDSVYSLRGPAVCEIMERFVSRIPRTEREYSHFSPVHSPAKNVQPLDNSSVLSLLELASK